MSEARPDPIVTITSDFGTGSPYVAAMAGVILGLAPQARLVEVSSAVPPFDVSGGAFVLWAGTRHFPAGAVHLAVVDPGVGTARGAVAFSAGGSWYVGPDNGLFSLVAETSGGISGLVQLRRPPDASPTFEGRDVFAPAAGALAAGRPLQELGDPLPGARLQELPRAQPAVLWVDNFGNLVTNLRARPAGVRIAGQVVTSTVRTFGEADPRHPFLFLGSMGFWEIGVREGRADVTLGARAGTPLEPLR